MDSISKLKAFRQAAYENLCRAHDSMFELKDAVILTRKIYSLAELSLSPVFRRKWPSIYEAVEDSRPQRNKLMRLYIDQIRVPETQSRIILAGDHTAWARPHAVTLQDRTMEHYVTGIPNNKPVAPGEGYSTLVWVPEESGSWALPLRHERITSWESPISKAVWQLKQVCKYLPSRPISLWDSEYGCAPFVLKTADINADKLMRLRSNLCLWSPPPAYSGRGRPRIHGSKFKLSDQQTWSQPTHILELEDTKLGRVRIRIWHDLHFRAAAKHPMSILLVERLKEDGSARVAKPLWLAWVGEQMPSLSEVWRLYLRRFAVDHWYRFIKQRLHWTVPKFATPKQCERWSDLMPIITWELWLARDIALDNPLPWQKSIEQMTPGRVAQSMGAVLTTIGSPASSPKPRGKSPGWKTGQQRQRKNRFPIVKKRTYKHRKQTTKSA
jgi:hypothetical protein